MRSLRAPAVVVLVLGLIACAHARAPGSRSTVSFGVFGDLGYDQAHEPLLENVLTDLDRARLAFVVHLGDLGSPTARPSSCREDLWNHRLGQFNRLAHPLIYTPGDNDWTDCHRRGDDPQERLARLRTVFFRTAASLGRSPVPLTRQSAEFPENVRWAAADVTFTTLHVVGSDNGWLDRQQPPGGSEWDRRTKANLAWLRSAFDTAREKQHRAVVIFQQANPFEAPQATRNGFLPLLHDLKDQTTRFEGRVVLVHGDTHRFRINDHSCPIDERKYPGLGLGALQNFTRVEADGMPFHHWVEGTVEPDGAQVVTFRRRCVPTNPHCTPVGPCDRLLSGREDRR
jgi:predicted phosphodiesterase